AARVGEPALRSHADRDLAPPAVDPAHRRPPGADRRRRRGGGPAARADRARRARGGVLLRGAARRRHGSGGAMSATAPVRAIGASTLDLVSGLGRFTLFVLAVLDAGRRPPLRLRRLVGEIYDAGVLSLLIVCVSGFAVGMVLGLQGYNTLSRFGAEESLGAVVGLSLIRELGPVLTSLLVAGRAGSAMAAEIAAMVVTEQLDGLRMMSVEPLDFVV